MKKKDNKWNFNEIKGKKGGGGGGNRWLPKEKRKETDAPESARTKRVKKVKTGYEKTRINISSEGSTRKVSKRTWGNKEKEGKKRRETEINES